MRSSSGAWRFSPPAVEPSLALPRQKGEGSRLRTQPARLLQPRRPRARATSPPGEKRSHGSTLGLKPRRLVTGTRFLRVFLHRTTPRGKTGRRRARHLRELTIPRSPRSVTRQAWAGLPSATEWSRTLDHLHRKKTLIFRPSALSLHIDHIGALAAGVGLRPPAFRRSSGAHWHRDWGLAVRRVAQTRAMYRRGSRRRAAGSQDHARRRADLDAGGGTRTPTRGL